MENQSQDERRKMEDEKHHPHEKQYIKNVEPKYSINKPSHVYSSPASLKKSLNKLFPGNNNKRMNRGGRGR